MRPFLLPALLGVAMLLGCGLWLSGHWDQFTDRPFHQVVAGSAGVRTNTCEPHRCDFNLAEAGFVAVEVHGPQVAVAFHRLGSTDPVHTIRFAKER